jgi:hypoxanthine phosphoribosyltransferase
LNWVGGARCEALRAKQVYWAEREDEDQPLDFRRFLEQTPGEQVVLVDDILRSGSKLHEMKELLGSRGARVVGLGVIIYQPTARTRDFGNLPLYYLAKLSASYYADTAHCDLCSVACNRRMRQNENRWRIKRWTRSNGIYSGKDSTKRRSLTCDDSRRRGKNARHLDTCRLTV